jgi:hypothetical protein
MPEGLGSECGLHTEIFYRFRFMVYPFQTQTQVNKMLVSVEDKE